MEDMGKREERWRMRGRREERWRIRGRGRRGGG